MTRSAKETHILTSFDFLVEKREVEVGVIVAPDETNPFGLWIPVHFAKTITTKRSFGIRGTLKIEGEEVYATSTYLGGFSPIEMIIEKRNKLKTGIARVCVEIEDAPIVVLPERERNSWEMEKTEYRHVPSNWIDCSTPEGKAFFEEEYARFCLKGNERFEALGNEQRLADADIFYIRPRKETREIYSSEKTPEQNHAILSEFLSSNNQKFCPEELASLLKEIA